MEKERKFAADKLSELLSIIQQSLKQAQTRGENIPQELEFLKHEISEDDCTSIGLDEGLMNYIYRLRDTKSKNSNSVVVKWSRFVPRLQELNDFGFDPNSFYAFAKRNARDCMTNTVIKKFIPGVMPLIYWEDYEQNFYIMEDLDDYVTMKQQLIKGEVKQWIFEKVANFLATLHKSTHVKNLPPQDFRKLLEQFRSDDADKYMTKWCYRDCCESSTYCRKTASLEKALPEIVRNDKVRGSLEILSRAYIERRECLVHNDSHPGFVMVRDYDKSIKVIDMEVSRIGYPARDVGYFLGEVIIWYYVNLGKKKHDVSNIILEGVRILLTCYVKEMGDLIEDPQDFYQMVAAHAGHFNAIRTVTLTPIPEFDGSEEEEADCVLAASRLLKQMSSVNSLDEFIKMAFHKTL